MTDYIKELEVRNELLSNRLEAAERLVDEPDLEYLLTKTIMFNKRMSLELQNTDNLHFCHRIINFNPCSYISVSLAAHKVASKLFSLSIYVTKNNKHARNLKSKYRKYNKNILYIPLLEIDIIRGCPLKNFDCVFVDVKIDEDFKYHKFSVFEPVMSKICPIIILGSLNGLID